MAPTRADDTGPKIHPARRTGIYANVIEIGFICKYPKNEKDINNSIAMIPAKRQF